MNRIYIENMTEYKRRVLDKTTHIDSLRDTLSTLIDLYEQLGKRVSILTETYLDGKAEVKQNLKLYQDKLREDKNYIAADVIREFLKNAR